MNKTILLASSLAAIFGQISEQPIRITSNYQKLDSQTRQIVLSQFDQDFIKPNFANLSLPEGAFVSVSNGIDETYVYDGKTFDDATVDAKLGEDGINSFSSLSVNGSEIFVTLNIPEGVVYDDEVNDVTISSFQSGSFGDIFPEPESLCGQDDSVEAACSNLKSAPVARLVMGRGLCTASRIGNGNTMITNWHCIGTQAATSGSEVWFNYQSATCNGGRAATPVKVPCDRLLKTSGSQALDYSVFTVKNFDKVRQFGNYYIESSLPANGTPIHIAQHPAGNPKRVAVCTAQTGNGNNVGYQCDTKGGSSGSPVLRTSTNKLIALHHLGGCSATGGRNLGAKMSLIYPSIIDLIDNNDDGRTPPTISPPTISPPTMSPPTVSPSTISPPTTQPPTDGCNAKCFKGCKVCLSPAYYHCTGCCSGYTQQGSTCAKN